MSLPRKMQGVKSNFENYWHFMSTENIKIFKAYLFTLSHLKLTMIFFERTEVSKT